MDIVRILQNFMILPFIIKFYFGLPISSISLFFLKAKQVSTQVSGMEEICASGDPLLAFDFC